MENKNVVVKKKGPRAFIIVLLVVVLLAGLLAGFTYFGTKATGDILTHNLVEPLDGATSAKVTIDPGDGNLTIDHAAGNENLLASGSLQYYERAGIPASTVTTTKGFATFSLKSNGEQQWLQLPWEACNNATDWLIHLNPSVALDITVLTGGGNVKIDLTGMNVTRLAAETGGGNMEISLPENAANLDLSAKTGAGKVTIRVGNNITGSNTIAASSGAGEVTVLVPTGVLARIKVTQGNVIVDPAFTKIDETTYETAGYQSAADKVEITVGSGAGKVNIQSQ